jgi:hypothetical protein
MATTGTYTLQDFVGDLDRITREESSAQRITERAAPCSRGWCAIRARSRPGT